jgi:hypothetical protein
MLQFCTWQQHEPHSNVLNIGSLRLLFSGAQAALVALYQSIQARTSWHEPLLSLSGRLELVRAQRMSNVQSAEAPKPMVSVVRVLLTIDHRSAWPLTKAMRCVQMEYFESDTDDAIDSEHTASELSAEGELLSGDDEASGDAGSSSSESSEADMSE